MIFRKTCIGILFLALLVSSVGCVNIRKKFTRKKKKAKEVEMVIHPRDYSKQELPADELYRQYYDYWRAWHNELLVYVKQWDNKKKILSCFEQTILNLNRLNELLADEEKSNRLQEIIDEVLALEKEFKTKNILMISMSRMKTKIAFLLRTIPKEFAPSRTKEFLKWN